MNDQVNLSSLLSGTVEQLQAQGRLVLIYLALMIPLVTASTYFEGQGGGSGSAFDFGFSIDEALISQGAVAVTVVISVFIIGMLAHYWLFAGMTRRTEAPSFNRFFPYLGMYILSSIAIVFGFVLFIVPGFILSVRWIALLPIVIDRGDRAMDAFGDSWKMTQGYGWSIFGAGLIIGIALLGVAIVFGLATAFSGPASLFGSFLSASLETVFTAVFAALSVTVYNQLRDDNDALTNVFE